MLGQLLSSPAAGLVLVLLVAASLRWKPSQLPPRSGRDLCQEQLPRLVQGLVTGEDKATLGSPSSLPWELHARLLPVLALEQAPSRASAPTQVPTVICVISFGVLGERPSLQGTLPLCAASTQLCSAAHQGATSAPACLAHAVSLAEQGKGGAKSPLTLLPRACLLQQLISGCPRLVWHIPSCIRAVRCP